MSFESDFRDTIKSLVSDRVYPYPAPQGSPLPYVVFEQVGGEALGFVNPELVPMKHARMQVRVWAASRIVAAPLARSIEDELVLATAFQCEAVGAPSAEFDDELNRHGTIQDFYCWFAD
jgi:hypothetical protein